MHWPWYYHAKQLLFTIWAGYTVVSTTLANIVASIVRVVRILEVHVILICLNSWWLTHYIANFDLTTEIIESKYVFYYLLHGRLSRWPSVEGRTLNSRRASQRLTNWHPVASLISVHHLRSTTGLVGPVSV